MVTINRPLRRSWAGGHPAGDCLTKRLQWTAGVRRSSRLSALAPPRLSTVVRPRDATTMKRICAFAITVGLVAGWVAADRGLCADGGAGVTTKSGGSVEDALIRIEQEWGDAMVKADVAAFSRCVADEWVLTASDGTRITKPMAQADLKENRLKIESFRLDDVSVRVYGDMAIVFGLITEKSRFRDKDTSGKRRFTDVFVKRDGAAA